MSWAPHRGGFRRPERYVPPFAKNGLVATQAATARARFGRWPTDFLDIVRRMYAGRIPAHVEELRARLERDRPWERCVHGISLIVDFCLECQS